jgi:hypothetical protein
MVVPLYKVTIFALPIEIIPNTKIPIQRDYSFKPKNVKNVHD